jgi:hypothetical protein
MASDLLRIGDEEGRKILISECHDSSQPGIDRMYAVTSLSRDFQDASCLEPVLDVLQANGDPKDYGIKEQALNLTPSLITLVDHERAQRIFELVTKSLYDPLPFLRITSAATLERLGDTRAIPYLEPAITQETDDGCVHMMKLSLQALQNKALSQRQ